MREASTPDPPVGVEILLASSRRDSRWRNGAGSTSEIARGGGSADDFDWRVSVACLDGAAAFSRFPGVDRVLLPIEAAGVVLEVAGRRTAVAPGGRCAFAGESEVVVVRLPDGPTRCLNVMTRRGRPAARIGVLEPDAHVFVEEGEVAILLALAPAVVRTLAPGRTVALGPLDAVSVRGPRPSGQIEGGPVVAVRVRG